MKVNIKTPEEIEIMKIGGAMLSRVKKGLKDAVEVGVSAADIEKLANELIEKEGAESSFKKVPGYSWSTCVNLNDSVVHGIPHATIVFKKNDLVSVDVGIFYKGFHTDTSFSKYLGKDPEIKEFVRLGREALDKAISQAQVGNKIEDISRAFETAIRGGGANVIKSLVGHGVGRELHEDPMIPCYVSGSDSERVQIKVGMTLALEVMYTQGKPGIKLDADGWTLRTKDGKLSALFEETVAITADGPLVLTK